MVVVEVRIESLVPKQDSKWWDWVAFCSIIDQAGPMEIPKQPRLIAEQIYFLQIGSRGPSLYRLPKEVIKHQHRSKSSVQQYVLLETSTGTMMAQNLTNF